MGDNRTASLRTAWLVFCVLCVSALVLVTTAAGADPTPAECDLRVNDTPSKLVECIQTDDLMAHMQAFQDIADANPGPDGMPSRNSGEPGYKASADYVAQAMKDAGYDVTLQKYQFDYYAYTGIPSFSVNGHASCSARTGVRGRASGP